MIHSTDILATVRRPDGSEITVRVPHAHLQQLMDRAAAEFGDPSVNLGGPTLPKKERK